MKKLNESLDPLTQVLEGMEIDIPSEGLPDPSAINYYLFEQDRKLFLEEDVGFPIMEMIKLILRWNKADKDVPVEERKPITIYIMSDGGSLPYMWSMIDIMLASKTPITTVNLGIAASAASLIFLAGSTRLMMPTATVIVHEGSAEMGGDANKLMNAVDNYRIEIKKMKDYILSRTEIPPRTMTNHSKDDWYIGAEECMKYSVCTKVIESLDEII